MTRHARDLGRVAVQQRVLPTYRGAFLDSLASRCGGGLHVFAGSPRRGEAIVLADAVRRAAWRRARNIHLLWGPFYLCLQPEMTAWLAEVDPDVLVLEANWRYPSNWKAVSWMKAHDRPVIGWGLGAPGGPASLLRRPMLRALDAVVAYSTRGAAEYAAAGVPVDRLYVAPNAVDAPRVRLPQRGRAGRRPVRILFVGRLQRRKRVDRLLHACSRVSPKPELCIIGDGPDRERLESIAGETFPSAVFAGALHGRALQAQFDRADLFVLPGTGGLALQQALANGLPLIAGRGDGSQEDMVTPSNGWLVPEDDEQALQRILQEALRDPARLASMGAASFTLARHHFNPKVMVDVFARALRDVRGP